MPEKFQQAFSHITLASYIRTPSTLYLSEGVLFLFGKL